MSKRGAWWTPEVEAEVRALLAEGVPQPRIAARIGCGLSTLEMRLRQMRARDAGRPAPLAAERHPDLPVPTNAAAFERAFVPPAARPVAAPVAPAPRRPWVSVLEGVPDPAVFARARRAGCGPVPT